MTRAGLLRPLLLGSCVVLFTGYASLSASPIRQLTSTQAANLRPVLSPDAKRIAFQSNRDGPYHIYVMEADGSNARRVTSGDADDRHPSWSPDGKFLAVDSGDQLRRDIWIIDVATGTRTQITKLGVNATFPSWSPDGKRLAFYVYEGGAMDLWLVGRDGSTPTAMTRGLASERNQQCTFACHAATWSPDGNKIALADGDGSRVILMSSLVASAQTPISPEDERSHFPIFMPDGRIIYVSEHVSQDQSWTDLWLVDPDNSDTRSQVAQGIQAQGPFELSTDARQLLFASPRTGNFEIYAVTLDDAGKAALAERPPRLSATSTSPQTQPTTTTTTTPSAGGLPDNPGVYFMVVGALGLLGLGIGSLRSRKRTPKKR